MLENLILIIQIIGIIGKCINQCEIDTLEDCMNCISLMGFQKQTHFLKFYCNFWDGSECFIDDYILIISKESLIINYQKNKNQQKLTFDKIRTGDIEIKTNKDNKAWNREEVHLLSNPESTLLEFIFLLKLSENEPALSFWAIGILSDPQYIFKGFMHVQEWNLDYNLDLYGIPDHTLACTQCGDSCPIWRWPDFCAEDPQRNLGVVCNTDEFYWTVSSTCMKCDADCSNCVGTYFFLCNTCTSNYFLVDSICLNACPYGFATNPCTSLNSPVIDQQFNTGFNGTYGIFQTSNSSLTYYFFNNSDLSDPIPAYNRGLYFSPGKYLKTNVNIYLNYEFSIGLWVYAMNFGEIIYKESSFTYNTTSINYRWQGWDKSILSTSYEISNIDKWAYISIVSYYSDNTCGIKYFLNNVLIVRDTSQGSIFKDSSSSPIFLGQGDFDSFTGYIYSFTLWNTEIIDFSYEMGLACPATNNASCLWTCDINQFFNSSGILGYCSNCFDGCVRGFSCNICNDPLCAVCSSFEQGSCLTCVENAWGGGLLPCQCNSGYASGDSFSCTKGCYIGCSECQGFSYSACTLCEPGYFLYQHICYELCPAGTKSQSNPNVCIEESPFSVQLDFYQLDSLPDEYEASGPFYVNDRGWFFNEKDYVSTINKLPDFLSISIWAYFWSYNSDFMIFYINRDWGLSYSSSSQMLIFNTSSIDWSFSTSLSTFTLNSWHSIFISLFHDVKDGAYFKIILDSTKRASKSLNNTASAIFSDKSYTKYIGCQADWCRQGKSGFIGYMYLFHIYRDAFLQVPSIETWISALPAQCGYQEYLSPYGCINCDILCTHGCNNPSNCTLCSIEGCLTCTGSNMCSQCSGNNVFISSSCTCPYTFSIDSIFGCSCFTGVEYSSVCMNSCPTGTIKYTGSCILDSDQGYIFSLTLNQIKGLVTDEVSGFQVLAGESIDFYPNFDAYDPVPAFERGYYFDQDFMQLPPHNVSQENSIHFSTQFSFSAWVWPRSEDGVIFTKLMSNYPYTEYLVLSFSKKNPVLTIYSSPVNASLTFESSIILGLNHWWYVGFSLSYDFPYSQANFYLDYLYSMASPGKGPFLDIDNNYSILIGARNKSPYYSGDYLIGFIYSVKIWNDVVNPSIYDVSYVNDSSICSFCPNSTYPDCMPLEEISSYYDNQTDSWYSCPSECTNGCVTYDSSCNLCDDPLCISCDDWTGCLECPDEYFYDNSTDSCELCPENCNNCTSGLYGDCTGCVDGFYLNPENICLYFCPLGYLASGTSCNEVSPNSLVIHYVFSQEINGVQDKVNRFLAYMGSTMDYVQSFDAQDPLPIYQRGLYFSGKSYAKLPPNSEDQREVVLGNNHSLMLWILPLRATDSPQPLFWKGNSTQSQFQLYFLNNIIYAEYSLNSVFLPYAENVMMQASSESLSSGQSWFNIISVLQWKMHTITVSLYIDGYIAPLYQILSNVFLIDFNNSNCYLGGSPITGLYFTGFIYEMEMYNYAITDPPTIGSDCGCDACANDQNDCLRSCSYLQYYSSSLSHMSSCIDCDSSCKYGCLKNGSCKMNIDDYCYRWTGFTIGECTSCVQNAVGAGTGCACIQYSSYNSTTDTCNCDPGYSLIAGVCNSTCPEGSTPQGSSCLCNMTYAEYDSELQQCVCSSGYWMSSLECVACDNFLNESSISASFSSDYSQIKFNFIIPANASSSCCSCLFNSSTLITFGVGYSCSFAADYSGLTIFLGKGYTFSTEKVEFLSGLLKNSVSICGISPTNFSVPVSLPNSIPTPSFTFSAPKTLAILCQSLIVTATPDYSLLYEQFKWTFSSIPASSIISAYSTQYNETYSDIIIPQSSLTDSVLTVTFSAKNNFGNISLKSQSINVTSSQTLIISFDPLMSTHVSRLKSYSISISSIEACKMSSSISVAWRIGSTVNNITAIDEKSLMGNQTSQYTLIIPPKVLPASSNITFIFIAKDLIYQTVGEASLIIQADVSDPVILLNRTDGPIGIKQDLLIDASNSYDPDGESLLSFQWICWNSGIDCSNFILNQSYSLMKIPGGSLSLGVTYNFTLILTKITLNPSSSKIVITKSIFIKAQDSIVPSVSIIEIGNPNVGIVSPDLAYRIQVEGSFSSVLWSVKGDLPYLFSTPSNSYSLVIAQNSLLAGSTYTLEALINQQFPFTWTFYVNQGPKGGNIVVNPNSGFEMVTNFEIKALNWDDPEGNLPIEYSFGYFISDIYQVISPKNLSSLIYSTFPYSKDLIIVSVDVSDSLSTKTSCFKSIAVSYQDNLNVDQYIDSMKVQLNSENLDPNSIPKLVSDLSSLSLNRNYIIYGDYSDLNEQMQDSYNLAIDKIYLFTKETDPYNPSTYTTIFSMLKTITLNPSVNSYDNVAKINDIISKLVSNLNGKAQLDDTQVQTFLEVCNNNFQVNSSTVENQTATITSIESNIHSINSALLTDMSSSESKSFLDEKVSYELSKQPASTLSNFSTEIIGASIKLASDITNFVSDAYAGTSLVLYDPISNGINASFSVVSFTLVDLSTSEPISLNNTNYNYISIPVQDFDSLSANKSNTTINCTYLEENQSKWRTDGCVLDSFNKTMITCKCTHLSIFSAFFGGAADTAQSSNIGDTVNVNAFSSIDWDTNAIGLYFCAVLLIVYITLIMLACKLDRKAEHPPDQEQKQAESDNCAEKNDELTDRSEDIVCKTDDSAVHSFRHKIGFGTESQEKPQNKSPRLSRADSMISVEDETIDTKPIEERRTIFEFIGKNHDFISIFFPDKQFTHSSRVTAYTVTLLGNMFFIGLFYQNEEKSDDSKSTSLNDTLNNYSYRDFWVMVYSSGIMIPVSIILRTLAKRNIKKYSDEAEQNRAKKRNKWKSVFFYLISWSLMSYFCWSIILFSIQFELHLTYKWICNTSVSYGSDIFVMPFIKMPVKVVLLWFSTKLIMTLGFSSSKKKAELE